MSVSESSTTTPALDAAEEDFESLRIASLREFVVRTDGGVFDHVVAHFHDGGASSGRLSFVIIDTTGRQMISVVYNATSWSSLREVTPPDRANELAQLKLSQAREAFLRQADVPMSVPAVPVQEAPARGLPGGRRKPSVH